MTQSPDSRRLEDGPRHTIENAPIDDEPFDPSEIEGSDDDPLTPHEDVARRFR